MFRYRSTCRLSATLLGLLFASQATLWAAGWKFAWSDEFDGPAVDSSVWGYETGYVRNQEVQYYSRRTENSRIVDGKLLIEALRDGLKDGTIDAIVSDHRPEDREHKVLEFGPAAFGIIGLETAFAVANTALKGRMSLRRMIERKGTADARLDEYRWLLEELRVSLFAQELRTPQPVSAKRLLKAWEQIEA